MIVIQAVLPIFLVVALGRAIAATGLIDRIGWSAIERIGLYILFPALIIDVLSTASFNGSTFAMLAALICGQLLMAAIGLLSHYWPGISKGSVAAIIQSNVRWHTFIGLSVAQAIFGSEGLALLAVAAAGMIPTANLISTSAFAAYSETPGSLRDRMVQIITNPLILACFIGGLLNITNLVPTGPIDDALGLVGQSAITVGLLTAGAAINFKSLHANLSKVLTWSLIRVLIMPILAVGLAYLFDINGLSRSIMIVATATPTASAGVILARQLNGDAALAANLIAMQALLVVFTLPLMLWLVQAV
ncbi:MAG: AEC family transporter [Henriciella sp.]